MDIIPTSDNALFSSDTVTSFVITQEQMTEDKEPDTQMIPSAESAEKDDISQFSLTLSGSNGSMFTISGSVKEDKDEQNSQEMCEIAGENPENKTEGQVHDTSEPEETRSKRRLRKRTQPDDYSTSRSADVQCPICGLNLRPSDLQGHVATETERLGRVARSNRKSSMASEGSSSGKKKLSKNKQRTSDVGGEEVPATPHERYQSYLRVRYHREKRAKEKLKSEEQETCCPVCNRHINGTSEELSQHVNRCLNGEPDPMDEDIDIEGEEEEDYEEYTWAGQTRIRATSMLHGGVAELGSGGCTKGTSDTDSDLDVDGDESQAFGTGQYSEADLLPCASEEPAEEKGRAAIRQALMVGETSSHGAQDTDEATSASGRLTPECADDTSSKEDTSTFQPQAGPSDRSPPPLRPVHGTESKSVISSLKAKIQELQAHIDSTEKMKCLICMDCYSTPLVSVQCWHVHCEECWLRTLGAKKLCPQCNMITSPRDLRRIYL